MKKRILIAVSMLLAIGDLSAQEDSPRKEWTESIGIQVFFRQGKTDLDMGYMGNRKSFDQFIKAISPMVTGTITADENGRHVLSKVSEIHIVAGASPEGSSELNQKLSEERAESIRKALMELIPESTGLFRIEAVGVDWNGLRKMVETSGMPQKDTVMKIIDETPVWITDSKGETTDSRKIKLMELDGGAAWRYMFKEFFPELRGAGGKISCDITSVVLNLGAGSDIHTKLETPPLDSTLTFSPVPGQPVKPFMALKTNMLYDAALVPNIGIEFFLGKGWTIGADWMYAWWRIDRKHYYWRTYGGDLYVRKYFGKKAGVKPLQGHHLGVYGQILTYDMETGGRGYLGDRWSWGAGIEYGYSLPVARKLNIDFSIGAGYLTGEYMEYLPMDGHYVWQSTRQRHWFGPTKAEISLVWLLGRYNINSNKGGRR